MPGTAPRLNDGTILLRNIPHHLDQRLLRLVQKWCRKHPEWTVSIQRDER